MRTIKFRIYYQHDETGLIFSKVIYLGQFISPVPRRNKIAKCQFTGLKDSKEKEIYEGDIVKYHDYYESFGKVKQDERKIFPIVWDFKGLRFQVEESNEFGKWMANFYHHKEIEVIGNIYENPELLK